MEHIPPFKKKINISKEKEKLFGMKIVQCTNENNYNFSSH